MASRAPSETSSSSAPQDDVAPTNKTPKPSAFAALRLWLQRAGERLPLTWQGLVLGIICGVVLFQFGIRMRDWILLVVGAFGLLLVLLSCVSVGLSGLYLNWRLARLNAPRQSHIQKESAPLPILVDTGQHAITGFRLPRLVPPFIDFFGEWESPDVSISHILVGADRTEEVQFALRGRHHQITRVFEVRDLFGLAEVKWRMTEQREIEVWPRTHPHPPPFARSFSDGDDYFVPNRPRRGDRVDIRKYQPGDPIRMIHWKLTARSNEAYVRMPESSASHEKQVFAYLVTDEDDDLAAQSARFDLEYGIFGKVWRFGADGADEVATDVHRARRVLAHSGVRPARYGADLPTFLEKTQFQPDHHRLVLYASGGLHRWLPTMLPLLKRYGAVTTLLIANQVAPSMESWRRVSASNNAAEQAPTAKKGWLRWLLLPAEETPSVEEEPWDLLRQMAQEGLDLQLLQPPQGGTPRPQGKRPHTGKPGTRPPQTKKPQAMRSIPRPKTPPPPRQTR